MWGFKQSTYLKDPASYKLRTELRDRFQLVLKPKDYQTYLTVFRTEAKKYSNHPNIQLSYLGNSVIETITIEWLFEEFPVMNEGELNDLRKKIINRESISEFAIKLRLVDLAMKLYPNLNPTMKFPETILKSLVATIFLANGYNTTQVFYIQNVLNPFVDKQAIVHTIFNYKESLFKLCQQKYKMIPTFETVRSKNQSNAFDSKIKIDGKTIAYARAITFRQAVEKASELAYHNLKNEEQPLSEA